MNSVIVFTLNFDLYSGTTLQAWNADSLNDSQLYNVKLGSRIQTLESYMAYYSYSNSTTYSSNYVNDILIPVKAKKEY